MKKEHISIGDNEYDVIIADTEETKQRGLRKVNKLPESKGMLFVWKEPQTVSMTMDETLIPLDLIFMDEEGEVLKVAHRDDTEQDNLISCENTKYVLEVNINSGIEEGDIMEEVTGEEIESESNTPVMKVLAPDGSTLMELKGGERIVSRRETKILIKKAKKVQKTQGDKTSLFKALGKYIFKVFKKLDERDPEYVLAPN